MFFLSVKLCTFHQRFLNKWHLLYDDIMNMHIQCICAEITEMIDQDGKGAQQLFLQIGMLLLDMQFLPDFSAYKLIQAALIHIRFHKAFHGAVVL